MKAGLKIKEFRKRKGWSQELLADNANVSLRTIQRVESGDNFPNGDTLIKITQALDVSIEDIMAG